MSKLSLLILVVLVTQLHSHQAFGQAEDVNSWLGKDQIDRTNPKRLLRVLKDATKYYDGNKLTMSEQLEDQWRAFIGLAEIKSKKHCSVSTSNILKRFLTQFGIDQNQMTKTHVGWLTYDLIHSIASECEPVFSKAYRNFMKRLPQKDATLLTVLTRTSKFVYGMDEEDRLDQGDEQINRLTEQMSQGDISQVAAVVRHLSSFFGHRSSDEKVNKVYFRAQMACADYVSSTGQIFKAAHSHAQTMGKPNYGGLAEGFVTYRVCEAFYRRRAEEVLAALSN